MLKRLAIITGLALAAPVPFAFAQDASAPVELWGGITTASNVDDIKALKAQNPRKRVEVFPGCFSELGWRKVDGRLVSLLFLGQDGEADCYARMFADLQQRLGEPDVGETSFGSVIGYGNGVVVDTRSEGTVLTWQEGVRKTRLIKSPGNSYNFIVTVRTDNRLY